MQLPPVPLPPPWSDGAFVTPSGKAGPDGAPTSKEDWELLRLEAATFNAGLEEVGGPRWREVLGAETAGNHVTKRDVGGGSGKEASRGGGGGRAPD